MKTKLNICSLCKLHFDDAKLPKSTPQNDEVVMQTSDPVVLELVLCEDDVLCQICLNYTTEASIGSVVKLVKEQMAGQRIKHATCFVLNLHIPNDSVQRALIVQRLLRANSDLSVAEHEFRYFFKQQFLLKLAADLGLKANKVSPFEIEVSFENGSRDQSLLGADKQNEHKNKPGPSTKRAKLQPRDGAGHTESATESTSRAQHDLFVQHLCNTNTAAAFDLSVSAASVGQASVRVGHVPIYLAGRYNKFSRHLPQTAYGPLHDEDDSLASTKVAYEHSVAELIAVPIKQSMRADAHRFLASGREDIDVRMLGEGRPFALELVNCREPLPSLQHLCDLVNQSTAHVRIHQLLSITKALLTHIKTGEQDKRKHYTALCRASERVSEEQLRALSIACPLDIAQNTPIRVLQRRNLQCRPRTLYSIKAWQASLSRNTFFVQMQTQAGTYVKEFVHGDFGRTSPSLKQLLGLSASASVDILELDVDAVDMTWPPCSATM